MTSDGSNSRTTTISAAASRDISPGTTVQTLQDKRRHFGRGAACPKPRPNVALGPVNIEMACTLFNEYNLALRVVFGADGEIVFVDGAFALPGDIENLA